jgi:hypothetical protein
MLPIHEPSFKGFWSKQYYKRVEFHSFLTSLRELEFVNAPPGPNSPKQICTLYNVAMCRTAQQYTFTITYFQRSESGIKLAQEYKDMPRYGF